MAKVNLIFEKRPDQIIKRGGCKGVFLFDESNGFFNLSIRRDFKHLFSIYTHFYLSKESPESLLSISLPDGRKFDFTPEEFIYLLENSKTDGI